MEVKKTNENFKPRAYCNRPGTYVRGIIAYVCLIYANVYR